MTILTAISQCWEVERRMAELEETVASTAKSKVVPFRQKEA